MFRKSQVPIHCRRRLLGLWIVFAIAVGCAEQAPEVASPVAENPQAAPEVSPHVELAELAPIDVAEPERTDPLIAAINEMYAEFEVCESQISSVSQILSQLSTKLAEANAELESRKKQLEATSDDFKRATEDLEVTQAELAWVRTHRTRIFAEFERRAAASRQQFNAKKLSESNETKEAASSRDPIDSLSKLDSNSAEGDAALTGDASDATAGYDRALFEQSVENWEESRRAEIVSHWKNYLTCEESFDRAKAERLRSQKQVDDLNSHIDRIKLQKRELDRQRANLFASILAAVRKSSELSEAAHEDRSSQR